MSIIIDSFQQRSPEWYSAIAGNPGGSGITKIITGTGQRSKQWEDYLLQLAGETLIGRPEETFQSQAMINGISREEQSRLAFEMIYGIPVKQVGIVYKDDRRLYHCSPDGLPGDAVLELKNPMLKTAVKYLMAGELPQEYFPQCQMELFVTERELLYFMSHYEGLPPFIIEVPRDKRFISTLEVYLEEFCGELNEKVIKLKEVIGNMGSSTITIPSGPTFSSKECPERPDSFMEKQFCDKCKSRLGCGAWQ